jgi:hypothetical protein
MNGFLMPLSRDLVMFWGEWNAIRTNAAVYVSSAYIKCPLLCYDGKRPSRNVAFDLDLGRFQYDKITFTLSFNLGFPITTAANDLSHIALIF